MCSGEQETADVEDEKGKNKDNSSRSSCCKYHHTSRGIGFIKEP